MGEVPLDDGEDGHRHRETDNRIRVGGNWSAVPTGISCKIALAALAMYRSAETWRWEPVWR